MESLFILIVLGLLVVIIVGSIMGITAHSRIGRLETDLKIIKHKLKNPEWIPPKPAPLTPPDKPVAAEHRPEETKAKDGVDALKPALAARRETPPDLVKQGAERQPKSTVKPSRPPKPRRSFEETIGSQWSVWVGGLALFLGAVFLLRYTIEAGFFRPEIRIFMAVILGAGLLAAGEFLRRADSKTLLKFTTAQNLAQQAYIPGVLTAVGIFTLLGSVYAAYALYGFIGPATAFILMGGLSLAGLALGLLHGPMLAALGLAASLSTPLLIQTSEPNAYVLFTYLAIVSAAAVTLAKLRDWAWLTALTLFGAAGWLFLSLTATREAATFAAWLAFAGLMFTLSTLLATDGKNPDKKPVTLSTLTYSPLLASICGALTAFAVFLAADMNRFELPYYTTALATCAVLMTAAWLRPRQSWHVLTAGALGFVVIISRAVISGTWIDYAAVPILFSAAFMWLCYTRIFIPLTPLTQKQKNTLWALSSTGLPLGLFVLLNAINYDVSRMDTHVTAPALLALAVFNAAQAYRVWISNMATDYARLVFSVGAGTAYILAVMYGLSGIPETLGVMAGLMLAVLASRKMPTIEPRMVAGGIGIFTALHVIFDRLPGPSNISNTLILNELWIYLALPALLCAGAAWALTRSSRDIWSEGLKALALTLGALFVIFQIRHLMNGGDILAEAFSFDELALQVLTGLSFTFGSMFMTTHKTGETTQPHDRLIPTLAAGVSVLTFLLFAFGLCLVKAPLLSGDITVNGGLVFNGLLLAYLIPAILLAVIAYMSNGERPKIYVQAAGALSLIAVMFYLTSMVRFLLTGPMISIFDTPPKDVELYAISAGWLGLGIALLIFGLKRRRKDLRLASAVVITLTVLKAFLIDMASLEGVLRAISFVVLGLVLIVIGRAYQRLLVSEKITPQE